MKTKSLIEGFSIVALSLLSMHATAQWSGAKSIRGAKYGNQGAFAFTINGKGYVGAGVTDTVLHEYDPISNTWTNKGALPQAIRLMFTMSFVIDDKAYLVGGDSMGDFRQEVFMYEPVTNTWTKRHDFPSGDRDAGFAFSIGDYGYVGGGTDGVYYLNDLWKYDPTGDSWTKEPNDVPVSALFPSCFVANNKAYVLLGGAYPSATDSIVSMWQFDPAGSTWTERADFPGSPREDAFTFSNSQYGYVGGGEQNFTTNYYDMWRYDANADKWSASDAIPLYGPRGNSTFIINNTAYVGLGVKITPAGSIGIDTFYKYTMTAPTSVASLNKTSIKWMLYPNPATDKISIAGKVNDFIISIYDETGHRVKQNHMVNAGQISIEDLTPGMYSLEVNAGGEISSEHFIKK